LALATAAPHSFQGAPVQNEHRLEIDVKATFVFQFSRYAEWPAARTPAATAAAKPPFTICAVADGGFNRSLDKVLEGETIDGRRMIRKLPDTLEETQDCQILYLGDIEPERVKPLLASVEGLPVLTIGETPEFLTWGGQILLVRDGKRIRFDINLKAARRNNIVLRSQLLRIARHVY
jgi:hypothetical protein